MSGRDEEKGVREREEERRRLHVKGNKCGKGTCLNSNKCV